MMKGGSKQYKKEFSYQYTILELYRTQMSGQRYTLSVMGAFTLNVC